ncbi:MAG: PTS sugar transporter subunit IIA [Deltaproteobacteria bacterium]|nr:PTS sugar transporter subunit IIA [Deltaproteobacteria bacterium]
MADSGSIRLADLLDRGALLPDLQAGAKDAVLRQIVAALAEKHADLDGEAALQSLLEREQLGSTGVGEGVAIPHAKIDVPEVLAALARCPEGVDFEAVDGERVKLFFVLLTPRGEPALHLKALARVSRILGGAELRAELLGCETGEALHQAVRALEQRL